MFLHCQLLVLAILLAAHPAHGQWASSGTSIDLAFDTSSGGAWGITEEWVTFDAVNYRRFTVLHVGARDFEVPYRLWKLGAIGVAGLIALLALARYCGKRSPNDSSRRDAAAP